MDVSPRRSFGEGFGCQEHQFATGVPEELFAGDDGSKCLILLKGGNLRGEKRPR
jgi:hypothetical protein